MQQAQIVSATLGQDALHAGLIAGAVGLALVSLYMIAFYRVLGLFAVLKLTIEGALLWTVISYVVGSFLSGSAGCEYYVGGGRG